MVKTKKTIEVLTKHGRTAKQLQRFYDKNRAQLAKKIELFESPDPTYEPFLFCAKCKKEQPHIRKGCKEYNLRWESELKSMKSTGLMQNYACKVCGTERAWGLP